MKYLFPILAILILPRATAAQEKPRGKVEVTRKVEYYNVRGRNSAELRAAMNAKGPLNEAQGKRFDARTDWALSWDGLDFDRALAAKRIFRLTKWTLKLEATVILPRWENERDGLPFERRRWRVYLARLNLHEAGHVKLAEQTATALEQSFGKLGFFPSQKKLETAVKTRAEKILRDYTAKHGEYDRRTRHGKTQGARFP